LIGTAPAKRLDRGLAHQLFGGGQVDLDHAVLLEQAVCSGDAVLGPGKPVRQLHLHTFSSPRRSCHALS